MYFDIDFILYGLFIVAIGLSVYAQIKVSGAFRRYSSVLCYRGGNASEVARRMLDRNGLHNVRIERVRGNLTDHFDPRTNTLRLSDTVYDNPSAAAIGVAAHEVGHAIQHAEGYFPIRLRSALVPITSFASRTAWLFIMIGVLITAFSMTVSFGYYVLLAGVGLFAVTTAFQLVTLPCEFNASARAMEYLEASGSYSGDELFAARKMLSAAAMTYVAALAVSAIQLLRLLLLVNRRRR